MGATKMNVAVLAGGFSAEENISRESGQVVYESLKGGVYEPFLVIVDQNGWFWEDKPVDLTDFSISDGLSKIHFDAAFVAIHGSPGEDGLLQGYLEMKQIPYTTCDTLGASITFHKSLCKELVRGCGLSLARSVLLSASSGLENAVDECRSRLKLPLFVKPNQNGSSYGISKVNDWDALKPALVEGFRYDEELLVEEGIVGTEVTCGVYTRDGKPVALPLTEIVSKHEFFDYTAKYTSGEADEITPARISEELTQKCQQISLNVFDKLGLRGLVRIDYILRDNEFFFLEVNTVPGLSKNSIVPRMVRSTGMELGEFFAHLIKEAVRSTEKAELPEN